MKFFLDSAKFDEVKYAAQMWNISGVTTNPRHIHDSGRPFMTVIRELAELFKGTEKKISVEIDPHLDKWEDMVKQAHEFARISPNFVMKIPSNENGFKACQVLTSDGIRCNVTLVFSALQALQAMRMGAFYVSPFIGWKENNAEATRSLIDEIVRIKRQYEFTSEIIIAAVRNGRQIVEAAILGADIVTAGFNVYKEGFEHPYTSLGLTKFAEFWDKTKFE